MLPNWSVVVTTGRVEDLAGELEAPAAGAEVMMLPPAAMMMEASGEAVV